MNVACSTHARAGEGGTYMSVLTQSEVSPIGKLDTWLGCDLRPCDACARRDWKQPFSSAQGTS